MNMGKTTEKCQGEPNHPARSIERNWALFLTGKVDEVEERRGEPEERGRGGENRVLRTV